MLDMPVTDGPTPRSTDLGRERAWSGFGEGPGSLCGARDRPVGEEVGMNRARCGQRDRFDAGLYVIARRRSRGPELMRLPCRAGEALAVFTVGDASDSFVRLRGLEGDWFARATSPGELVSLLCGLYASIGWVSLNPQARLLSQEDARATMLERESFVTLLLCGTEAR